MAVSRQEKFSLALPLGRGSPMNEMELKENDRLFLNGLQLDEVEKYSIEKNGADDFTRLNVTLLVEIKG